MEFLVPAAWVATALALPVLIFYLIRQRARVRPVSTLLFWEQIRPQVHNRPFWRRFRQWLSYLFQVLFILLLTLALARPLLEWQSRRAVSYVFVLDPSVSMAARLDGGESPWTRSMEELDRRLNRLRPIDKATVVLAGDPPEILQGWTEKRRLLEESVEEAEPLEREVSPLAALELARNLASTAENAEVMFFTDGVLGQAFDAAALEGVTVREMGDEAANVGISKFAARRSLNVPEEFTLSARVDYTGGTGYRGVLREYVDGVQVDARELSLSPGESWESTWRRNASTSTRVRLEVEPVGEDALLADNAAEVALSPLETVNVFLVAEPNAFLQASFLALSGVRVSRVSPGAGLPEAPEGEPALYVFYRSRPPEGVVPPASILISPDGAGFWGEPEGQEEGVLLSEYERDDPLLRYASLEAVNFRNVTEYSIPEDADVLARSFDLPLIYGDWEGQNRWLALAFDLQDTDFALRTAFPIMMANAVQSLRGSDAADAAPLPGRTETQLKDVLEQTETGDGVDMPTGVWAALVGFPLWWWFALLGVLWCLLEWFLFTRRVTE